MNEEWELCCVVNGQGVIFFKAGAWKRHSLEEFAPKTLGNLSTFDKIELATKSTSHTKNYDAISVLLGQGWELFLSEGFSVTWFRRKSLE